MILLAAALAAATPSVAVPARAAPTAQPDKAKRNPMADFAAVMAMVDKIFPPQPAPDPRRLAAAQLTAQALLPAGAYGRGIGTFFGGFADRIMGMKESDLDDLAKAKPAKPRTPSEEAKRQLTLRQKLVAEDPHFEERMRLSKAAIQVELDKLAVVVEPKLRDGIARSLARRLDDRQLADANAFFATDSGRAMASHFLGLWFDPDMMRSLMTTMPELVFAMPGAITRIEAATAHLPKPPRKKKDEGKAK